MDYIKAALSSVVIPSDVAKLSFVKLAYLVGEKKYRSLLSYMKSLLWLMSNKYVK